MPGFLKNVSNGFLDTFKSHFSPKTYVDIFQKAPKEILDQVKSVAKINPMKSPGDFLKTLGGTAFSLYWPISGLMEAWSPNRPDLEYAGPFQNITNRLYDTAASLAWGMSANPLLKGSQWGAIPAMFGADMLLRNGLNYTSGLVDRLTGNLPDIPKSVNNNPDYFSRSVNSEYDRLSNKALSTNPGRLNRQAINNTLKSADDYINQVKLK
ncbi:MAG: hypothetical protein J6Y02_04900 [Pseudobutyrivibrio sp.]|nr:hypothetical protein [Pseudobutyrivibrio sp.]